jgi:nucleoside-diphosphate-sugar epimerase
MKVLVTGANGYVARWIIPELQREHEVVAFARQAPGGADSALPGVSFVAGDLAVLDDCRRAAEGMEAIVHLGGRPIPKPDTFEVNVLGTYHVLEAAREMGVRRVVLASSMCALGNCFRSTGRAFEIEYLPFDEAHPSHIEETYGLSKLVGEQTLQAYTRACDLEGVALRLAWCWGPKEVEWRRSETLNHDQFKSGFWGYVDTRDAAQAFRQAVETETGKLPRFGVYYISAADTFAGEPSAELVRRYYPQQARLADSLAGNQAFFNYQAAHRALGYAPQHSWRP